LFVLAAILLQGLLSGTAEQREQAALGLGDLVERTAPDFLKPSIPSIAGPLIRIVGERVPPPVKSALLLSLTTLLSRVPQYVRPFFPQLQRTFAKNVSEPSSLLVRNRATEGLGVLMALQTRVDPVVTELLNTSRSVDGEVRDSVVGALAAVVKSGGNNITAPIKSSVVEFLEDSFAEGGQRGDFLLLCSCYTRGSDLTRRFTTELSSIYVARLFAALSLHDPDLLQTIAKYVNERLVAVVKSWVVDPRGVLQDIHFWGRERGTIGEPDDS
jgi:hypothetical protein